MRTANRARLFAHVVDTSGAVDMLAAALRTDRRGRHGAGSVRTFLILLLCSAAEGELTINRMHYIATRELPRDLQIQLGIVRRSGDRRREMPIDELYYVSRTLTKKLAWTGRHARGLNGQQRAARRQTLTEITDRLICATLPDRPGTSYALDESAIWSWARGRAARTSGTDIPGQENPATAPQGQADSPDGARAADIEGGDQPVDTDDSQPLSACPDAAWGLKTGKSGQRDAYFGYGLHALVRVPDLRPGPSFTDDDDPILIEAIEVTPASTDIVDVSLRLLDRVRARRTVRDLAADKHYSYKEWNRWGKELWARGIRPVLDLREDEHGFRDYNGARIAASWPHCPATPMRLAAIPRPGPTSTKAAKATFAKHIAERETYAMRRINSHIPTGASRWECPARAGKLGCPLVEGTVHVARELGQLVVARPPSGPQLPTCCTQRTFMIRVEEPSDEDPARVRRRKVQLALAMKHAQDEYWGGARWQASFARRTYVEGAFGNLKNPNTERLRRGLFRFTGLPLVTLALAAAVVAANVRQLRKWRDRTGNGNPNDPLFAPEPDFHGFVLLDSADIAADGTTRGDRGARVDAGDPRRATSREVDVSPRSSWDGR